MAGFYPSIGFGYGQGRIPTPIPFGNGPFSTIEDIPDGSHSFGVLYLWEFMFPWLHPSTLSHQIILGGCLLVGNLFPSNSPL